jgi:hypothetical protein
VILCLRAGATIVVPYIRQHWRTQEFCTGGGGGERGSTNSVEDRGQRERERTGIWGLLSSSLFVVVEIERVSWN